MINNKQIFKFVQELECISTFCQNKNYKLIMEVKKQQILGKIINNYKFIKYQLIQKTEVVLLIELQSLKTFQRYNIEINQNIIDNIQCLKFLQLTPPHLQQKIVQNINDINVTEDASILVNMNIWGKTKVACFVLNKLQIDSVELIQQQINRMRQQFQSRISNLQSKRISQVKNDQHQCNIKIKDYQNLQNQVNNKFAVQFQTGFNISIARIQETFNKQILTLKNQHQQLQIIFNGSINEVKNIINDSRQVHKKQITDLSNEIYKINNHNHKLDNIDKDSLIIKSTCHSLQKVQIPSIVIKDAQIPSIMIQDIERKILQQINKYQFPHLQFIGEITTIKDSLDNIMKKYNYIQNKVLSMSTHMKDIENNVQKFIQIVRPIYIAKKYPKNLQHPDNPHNNRFKLQLKENSAKITYLGQGLDYYNWIKNVQIPRNSTTTFVIKQTKTFNNFIYTGISTNSMFGNIFFTNEQQITYDSSCGYIRKNGGRGQRGRPIFDGQLIKIVVDMIKGQVSWFIGYQRLANVIIPKIMLNKSLFLIVRMRDQNDMIQLLFQ